jgi:hypothetical protein
MALQYVEPTGFDYPPSVIYARTTGGGNQRGSGQGAGKPTKKATKKASKKSATKKLK